MGLWQLLKSSEVFLCPEEGLGQSPGNSQHKLWAWPQSITGPNTGCVLKGNYKNPSKWIISTLLGNSFFSHGFWKKHCQRLHLSQNKQLSEQKIKSTEFSEKDALLQGWDEGTWTVCLICPVQKLLSNFTLCNTKNPTQSCTSVQC